MTEKKVSKRKVVYVLLEPEKSTIHSKIDEMLTKCEAGTRAGYLRALMIIGADSLKSDNMELSRQIFSLGKRPSNKGVKKHQTFLRENAPSEKALIDQFDQLKKLYGAAPRLANEFATRGYEELRMASENKEARSKLEKHGKEIIDELIKIFNDREKPAQSSIQHVPVNTPDIAQNSVKEEPFEKKMPMAFDWGSKFGGLAGAGGAKSGK